MLHHQLNEEIHHALKNLYIPTTVHVTNCKNESLAIMITQWKGKSATNITYLFIY